jgi:hypothetical protein
MNKVDTIYVRLMDEPVDVWRPVEARHLRDDIYLILEQPYETDIEKWEFEPGQQVKCGTIQGSSGPIFAATEKAE